MAVLLTLTSGVILDQSENNNQQHFDAEIDASMLYCPLPVLRAKKALDQMSDNSILKLIATDPSSEKDIAAFVDQAGYKLSSTQHSKDTFIFFIEKTVFN